MQTCVYPVPCAYFRGCWNKQAPARRINVSADSISRIVSIIVVITNRRFGLRRSRPTIYNNNHSHSERTYLFVRGKLYVNSITTIIASASDTCNYDNYCVCTYLFTVRQQKASRWANRAPSTLLRMRFCDNAVFADWHYIGTVTSARICGTYWQYREAPLRFDAHCTRVLGIVICSGYEATIGD